MDTFHFNCSIDPQICRTINEEANRLATFGLNDPIGNKIKARATQIDRARHIAESALTILRKAEADYRNRIEQQTIDFDMAAVVTR